MDIEKHPFEPFIPDSPSILFMGTFPPQPKRWSMEFYYPNWTNDFWRIMGFIFYSDKNHFCDLQHKTYRLDVGQCNGGGTLKGQCVRKVP